MNKLLQLVLHIIFTAVCFDTNKRTAYNVHYNIHCSMFTIVFIVHYNVHCSVFTIVLTEIVDLSTGTAHILITNARA